MDSMLVERLRLHSQEQPHKNALIIDGKAYTYKELYTDLSHIEPTEDAVQSIANQTVTIDFIDTNSVYEQIVLWFASLMAGHIPVMAHRNMHDSYRHTLLELLGNVDIPKEAQFGVLTSGTTGMPKPLWRRESSWADFFDEQNRIFHIDSTCSIFLHGSFSFTGNTNMIVAVLWAGGTIVSSDKMQPKRWLSKIEDYRCSHIYLLPTKLRLLLRYGRHPIMAVRHIIAGSQVVDEQLIESLQILCPVMEFILYYGASELNYISYCTGSEWLTHPNTVGKPFPSVQIEIVDDTIYVSTDYGVCGIEQPATVGDKGYFDGEYLMFNGRTGDVVNRGGYKVSIGALEFSIQQLLPVDEVAVIGVPDPIRGEEVAAYIVPTKGYTVRDVEQSIHEHIASIEQPKYIRIVEAIPLTDCSKVDKSLLKEWYNKE